MVAAFKKIFPALALAALSFHTGAARADTFPSKPIRIIVSTSPGGLTDLLSRTVGKLMSDALGQQVVI